MHNSSSSKGDYFLSTVIRSILAGVIVAAMSACASIPASHEFVASEVFAKDLSLNGKRIYVYSFLDTISNDYGPKMVTEIDSQIVKEFAQSGMIVNLLSFLNSEPGKKFSLVKDKSGVGNVSINVPVGGTITSNQANERMFGAEYRLIVFPSVRSSSSKFNNYQIRWDIYHIKTGNLVWSATSKGLHEKRESNDQEAIYRAKQVVDSAVNELKSKKLL